MKYVLVSGLSIYFGWRLHRLFMLKVIVPEIQKVMSKCVIDAVMSTMTQEQADRFMTEFQVGVFKIQMNREGF